MSNKPLNGSADLLAIAITRIFEESQERTVSLLGEVEGRFEKKVDKLGSDLNQRIDGLEGKVADLGQGFECLGGKVDGLHAQVDGMRVQMNGMSKKIDRLQARQQASR